ncbi:MAG: flagellar motor switch protein FliG [Deltaproteobacteria bacterium]|nr:flagellar motor switch protein FliG [Deltaproteobacteria bacterium]MBW1934026.1 flagellar motor switch protein FliG [Deltaproteobacteria bacterium]MBW2043321.1 flagellar motor switch protein FliG [Deltaproteobacteria bacterium]
MSTNHLSPENLSGPQKVAIFLLAMGEEFTTNFLKHLDQKSIKEIGKHMSEITYIPSNVLDAIMGEFLTNFEKESSLAVSGREFLEQVVVKTLDEETAREVFKVIGSEKSSVPFKDLAYVPADTLVNAIKGEHPQTIALMLSYLPQEKAAEILSLLPEEAKADVALRIVHTGNVQDDLIRELDEAIRKELSNIGITAKKFDGVEILANILNKVDRKTEEHILSRIEEEDSDVAEHVRQKMFVFEDLLGVDNRGFRQILQNVENQVLIKALKTASDEMKNKVLSNLSERAAEMLKEDMEVLGPVRLKEVEKAQQEIIKVASKLEEEGKIVLGGKEDELV